MEEIQYTIRPSEMNCSEIANLIEYMSNNLFYGQVIEIYKQLQKMIEENK